MTEILKTLGFSYCNNFIFVYFLAEDITQRVTEIVSKVSTFFDSGKQIKDRAAAMLAFGELAALMTTSEGQKNLAAKDLFSDLIHQVMVSITFGLLEIKNRR